MPDLPVCAAVGKTREEVEKLIREAIEMHLEDLKQRGEPIPEASQFAASISVAA